MSELLDTHIIDESPPPDRQRVFKDIVAGTVGGIAQTLAGNPFDTVKVRLQSAEPGVYNGPGDVVKKLLQNEGPSGFYKGVLTPLVGIGACVSIQFAVNEYMKRHYTQKNGLKRGTLSLLQFYSCGCAAGLANAFLAAPIEHVRIRLQTQISAESAEAFKGPVDCIKRMYSSSGIRGIFRGLGPTLVREAHGLGVYFMTYEWLLKKTIEGAMSSNKTPVKREDIPGWKLCTYGGLLGITLWCSVYPIDIIKTRLQTDGLKLRVFSNSWDCYKYVMRTGGGKAFFEGFGVCLLRAFPANAVTFYAFELAMRALQ